MTTGMHPRHRLDSVIHAPVRLSIMAALSAADRIDFRMLRDTVEVSDSLLSKHIDTLEHAGYVRAIRDRTGTRPRTWLALTKEGQEAFREYVDTLQGIVRDA